MPETGFAPIDLPATYHPTIKTAKLMLVSEDDLFRCHPAVQQALNLVNAITPALAEVQNLHLLTTDEALGEYGRVLANMDMQGSDLWSFPKLQSLSLVTDIVPFRTIVTNLDADSGEKVTELHIEYPLAQDVISVSIESRIYMQTPATDVTYSSMLLDPTCRISQCNKVKIGFCKS